MKKAVSCIIMTMLILCTNISLVNASYIEKGNPAAIYSDRIILSNGNEVDLNEYTTLLFLNGTLITDYEIIIRNDRALVPVRLIAQELGASVDWNESNRVVSITKSQKEIVLAIDSNVAFVNGIEINLDYPAIIYKDLTYVPLRFVAENLDATVHYSPGQSLSPKYTYYYDTQMPVSPANTIIRNFANIIIDQKYDFSDLITKEEAMKKTQEICLEGLENFTKSMRENLVNLNENPNRNEFKVIKKEIDRMMYIGEVSRFYKFTIGPYDILFDRINHKIFFVIYSSGTTVKEVDINDTGLYLPIFIVG